MASSTVMIVIAVVGCAGLAACSSSASGPHAATPSPQTQQATVNGTTNPGAATATPNPTVAPGSTSSCVGLPVCTPPAPDAEGNLACYYRDGWVADPLGSGIDVYYFRESSDAAKGEQVTVDVRMKDGSTASQIAAIDPDQSSHQIQFPGIDKTSVQEVVVTTSAGRCFVIGPTGS